MILNRSNNKLIFGKSSAFESSSVPEISVLLPTFNREDVLHRTLQALERQSLEQELFEIIVVDDGSSDSTATVLKEFAKSTTNRFFYTVMKENGGPAKARNIGLSSVRGNVVLIIGDDIEPDVALLEKHLFFHKRHPDEQFALLGYVSFPDTLTSTKFMDWLETSGRKYFFNYAELVPGEEAEPIFFYTCNVSVKCSLLDKSGWFDETFPYASHEDLELGYRLADKGMRLVYDPGAQGYHWHLLTIKGIAKRVYLMGYSAELFWQKVGDHSSWSKKMTRKLLSIFCVLPPVIMLWNFLQSKEYSQTKTYPLHWKLLLFTGFFIGLSDAGNKKKIRV